MPGETQSLCVVTPCYNEADVIELFYEKLKSVLRSLEGLQHLILFVDDGSQDATLERLNALAARDPAVRVYSLSRNFGHQIALTAGLDAARGDAVVMMDSDLQHPPELILQFIEKWQEGYDLVYAYREETTDHPASRDWVEDTINSGGAPDAYHAALAIESGSGLSCMRMRTLSSSLTRSISAFNLRCISEIVIRLWK